MMISLRMALRYLQGRKLRTTLTTLAVVFGVAVIFGGNLALPSFVDAFKRVSQSTTDSVDLTVTGRAGAAFAAEEPLRMLARVNGVQAVTGLLRRQINLPPGTLGDTAQIELVGVDPTTIAAVRQFRLAQGRLLEPGDRHALVLAPVAVKTGPSIGAGSSIALPTAGGLQQYAVVGTLADRETLAGPQLIVTLSDAQAILNQPGQINTLELALRPGADRDAIVQEVSGVLGDAFVVGGGGSEGDAVATMNIAYAIFNLLGLMALFMGGFLIFNTFRTVVLERRHDLGMLRAIGAERRQVTRMILLESLLQGICGTAAGLLLGYAFAVLMISLGNAWAPQFLPGLHATLRLKPLPLLVAAGFGLLATLLAGYLPARAAGKVSPLEALRPSAPTSMQRTARWSFIAGMVMLVVAVFLLVSGPRTTAGGALLFLLGMVVAAPGLVLPVARLFSPMLSLWFANGEGQVAGGNLTRQPGRAAVTASTLMVGLAVLVVTTALVSSLVGYTTDVFNRAFASDILLVPQSIGVYGSNVGADERLAERLRAVPEVAVVGTLRPATATVGDSAVTVLGIDPAQYPQVSPLTFSTGAPGDTYAALARGRTAIVNPIMASTLKLKLGDDLALQTAGGKQTYRIVAVASDALNLKLNTIFTSQSNLAADFHKTDDVMLMLKLKPGADLDAARAAVGAIVAAYPQFSVHVTADYRENLLRQSIGATQVIFYLVGLIILVPAGLGLLNTLTINVLERTREIGIVRAVGGSRRQIRRMVTAEALLLGIFGAATGVLAGVAMSYGFVHAFSGATGWSLPYVFPLAGLLAAVVLGILLALFASVLPARNAARLDIIRALQYE